MTRPRMVVVGGPSGSGKSSLFSVQALADDAFDVDARATFHNGGSARGISASVRRRAQEECERFIEDHIARRVTFAVETTLRSGKAMDQAGRARSAGFEARLVFVTAGSDDECVHRVRLRGLSGGHAAREAEIRDIYARSMSNLSIAVDVFERIDLYDNSARGVPPVFIGTVTSGRLVSAAHALPDWVPAHLR